MDIKADLDRKGLTTTLAQLRATLQRRLGHSIAESTVRYLAKNLAEFASAGRVKTA